ncbi:Coa6p NDAI_0K00750 [Naumovozyma dairenensis CBS 421]|uniref:Cytochrome c oxidase assembly factor 6 n=1 Tax=Naumovozyma dairenensis (strain ATCC 10597 / BCRC 20456 / CBS 421 / NBRC 0211 / NRRL Y-12639) TaxID=1071378 RepID=G0WHK5_NAUDC|nr:hypothetical protein NDAI_0K00750 [Naumovozyma dairenensis CBS 421]CCD27266.1 hypothetical protein NDAI_0K00750 [Naumovozyma dairenensis CBS 421]
MTWNIIGKKEKKEPPNTRNARRLCWDSRDEYFKCLDSINVINPLDPKNSKKIQTSCKEQSNQFDQNCATSWIKYFKEKRFVDYKRERMLKEVEEQQELRDSERKS